MVRGEAPDVGAYGPALLLSVLNRCVDDAVQGALEGSGFGDIRRAHGVVFEALDPAGSRITEMARRARMTKQSMGELVAYLETHGYLERRPDPSDGRASLVGLTPTGQRAVEVARAALADLEAAWDLHLGGRRASAVRRALADLCIEFGSTHIR